MSIHPSLRGANSLLGDRSVYSRMERLAKLQHDGKWKEGDTPYGLPKVRTAVKAKKRKKAAASDDDGAAAAAEGEGEGAAGDASPGSGDEAK